MPPLNMWENVMTYYNTTFSNCNSRWTIQKINEILRKIYWFFTNHYNCTFEGWVLVLGLKSWKNQFWSYRALLALEVFGRLRKNLHRIQPGLWRSGNRPLHHGKAFASQPYKRTTIWPLGLDSLLFFTSLFVSFIFQKLRNTEVLKGKRFEYVEFNVHWTMSNLNNFIDASNNRI